VRDSVDVVCVMVEEKKRIVCMLVLIVVLFTVSWFPFFSVQFYLVNDDHRHGDSVTRTTVAVLQLLGYRSTAVFICCHFALHVLLYSQGKVKVKVNVYLYSASS